MKTKKCSKCRRAKGVKDFPKNASMPDGLYHYCKACNRKRQAKYFATPRGKAVIKRATAKRAAARRKARSKN